MSGDHKYSVAWVRNERHRRANLFAFNSKRSDGPDIISNVQSITRHLVCIQSQELDATLLALWTRLPYPRPSKAELLRLFSEPCTSVTRYWGPRVTLQLSVPDVRVLVSIACAKAVRHSRTLCLIRGLSEDYARKVRNALNSLEERAQELVEGQQRVTSYQLAELVTESTDQKLSELPVSLQKLLHQRLRYTIAVLLTVDGHAKRGIETKRIVTLTKDTTSLPQLDVTQATMAMARGYFNSYAPASEADFRRWVGIPALQSRQCVAALVSSGELAEIDTDLGRLLLPQPNIETVKESSGKFCEDVDATEDYNPPRVLFRGKFDPLVIAHAEKSWLIDDHWRSHVWSANADIAATVLVDGRIMGTWKLVKRSIAVALFEKISELDIIAGIKREALEIGRDYYGHEDVEVSVNQPFSGSRSRRKRLREG